MLLAVCIHLLRGLAEGLLSEIALVSEKDHRDRSVVRAPRHLGVDVRLPLGDCLEGAEAGEIEHHKGAHSFLVVHAGHVTEALLTGNIPQLKSHLCLGVPVDDLEGKVYADLFINNINN